MNKEGFLTLKEPADEYESLLVDYNSLRPASLEDELPRVDSIQMQNLGIEPNDHYIAICAFLHKIGITTQDLEEFKIPAFEECLSISKSNLLKLFQQETSYFFWLKWSKLDHLAEQSLQKLLGVGYQERSILLNTFSALMKAYGAHGLVKGIEMGLVKPVHYFIYAMLTYRFIKVLQTGSFHEDKLQNVFSGSNQKGIDSLVQILAKIEEKWLKLILTLPLIIGFFHSIWDMKNTWTFSGTTYKEIEEKINNHLQSSPNIWRDGLREIIPLLSLQLSISGKIQKLEQLIRRDGRLSLQIRKEAFQLICKIAVERRYIVQINAMQSLAKIAHGIAIKDLPQLQTAGYTKIDLLMILFMKTIAFEILLSLSSTVEIKKLSDVPRILYAQYLLWWLGQSTSFWKQRLPFFLFKSTKLALGVYFLRAIVLSILEAINCPDKPGFELGFGYPQYANELTLECYWQMIDQFRAVNINDSVAQLVFQTQYFNLKGLNEFQLTYKNLTGSEMVEIFRSAENRGARFTALELYDYFSDSDMRMLAIYLNNSNIQTLKLGCVDTMYPGGEGLTDQGLMYLANILPLLRQLTFLQLCFPQVGDSGITSLANILNTTRIVRFSMISSNMSDIGGMQMARTLKTMPIMRIALAGSSVGDETIYAFNNIIQYNPILNGIWISGNFITNDGAIYFSNMLKNSLVNTIGLASPNITDEGVIALSNTLKGLSLKTLIIGSRSGETGITTLMSQINKTQLDALEILYNNFTIGSMEAFASILPFTPLRYLLLNQNILNGESVTKLASGLYRSTVKLLRIFDIDMKDSLALLSPGLAYLETLQVTRGSLNDDSLISILPFLVNSSIQVVNLDSGQIGNNGVMRLSEILPSTRIWFLNLKNNNITDVGAAALENSYLLSALRYLYLTNNPVSTNILYQVEYFRWQRFCQDLLCHANAPWYSGLTVSGILPYTTQQNQINPKEKTLKLMKVDERKSINSPCFYLSIFSENISNQLISPNQIDILPPGTLKPIFEVEKIFMIAISAVIIYKKSYQLCQYSYNKLSSLFFNRERVRLSTQSRMSLVGQGTESAPSPATSPHQYVR